MKIVTWSELDEKEKLIPLMMLAFGEPFNPKETEEMIRLDPRLNRSEVGLCGIEEGRVVGFVGLLELATKNVDGATERVGGIWGVATLPNDARKGVSTLLMNEVHRHFRDKHYRFSFLATRRTYVAHDMYLKLGYEDVTEFPSAYKSIQGKKNSGRRASSTRPDWERILDIYRRYTSDKTGFVVRDASYLEMQQKRASIDFNSKVEVIVGKNGYVFYSDQRKSLEVAELVPDGEERSGELIGEIESQAEGLIYNRIVLDEKLLAAYKRKGYLTQSKSHSLLMAKPLTGDTTFRGNYSDRFYMTLLDFF